MDNQILGALFGLLVAVMNYFLVGQMIRQKEAQTGNNRDPKAARIISMLNMMRISEFVWMPALTYYLFGFIDDPIIKGTPG